MATLGEDMVAEVAGWVAGAEAGGAAGVGGDFAGGAASSAWLFLSRFPGKHIHESANAGDGEVEGESAAFYTSIERLEAWDLVRRTVLDWGTNPSSAFSRTRTATPIWGETHSRHCRPWMGPRLGILIRWPVVGGGRVSGAADVPDGQGASSG